MLFSGSRYAGTEVVVVEVEGQGRGDGATPRRVLATRRIPTAAGVVEYVVKEGDRLDHIAALFFGDPKKAWLILDANPEELNPFALLQPGRRIRIPANRIARLPAR